MQLPISSCDGASICIKHDSFANRQLEDICSPQRPHIWPGQRYRLAQSTLSCSHVASDKDLVDTNIAFSWREGGVRHSSRSRRCPGQDCRHIVMHLLQARGRSYIRLIRLAVLFERPHESDNSTQVSTYTILGCRDPYRFLKDRCSVKTLLGNRPRDRFAEIAPAKLSE